MVKMGRRCWTPRLLLLVVVLGQSLLFINHAASSAANKTIRIGYLLQFKNRAGAINVAIEQAKNDSLLPGYNFRYNCYERSLSLKLVLTENNGVADQQVHGSGTPNTIRF